ncbi:ADP-ribosylglycohydrolase family protein [Streptomyces europaeiscabiei]|nr:ADP-ribosylglycohydrolase family protein [Streptomyces europaeiscabiei]MDX3864951.1 ADP-ribosylglycohydrolase family protein [Streptomyces europaeiscabiei]MDX3872416.1 ADP-ribosylglycohydrolase family protein [Streptomyces europaeiscabiei]
MKVPHGERAAIDLGGDTDTVGAVTEGLAGTYCGLDAVPAHRTQPLHVPLPGFDGRVLHSRVLSVARAKSGGGLAEPAGQVVVQVLLIVADPGDMAVGA